MSLELFHPAVAGWFAARFPAPTEAQARAWPAIRSGRHTLVAAPTGSGKTLAAFLAALDELVREGLQASLPDETRVVYVSPLKALSNDIQRNLEAPLAGIADELRRRGLAPADVRTLVRTGDTPASERERMRRKPPHILVTTPESLYILLTSESGRRMLATARSVIVDEIHAVAQTKRGAHLALTLARLDALAGRPLTRIGLSATQRPIDEVARFLTGVGDDCTIIDTGHVRSRDLQLEVPPAPLTAVMSAEVWGQVYDRIADLARRHRTTLVFVNTRRMAERAARHLSERLGEENVAAHHGSLSRERRLEAEQRLKKGELQVLIATASLELGIDIGDVELVCQLGTPRAISTFLQRVGRSGHAVGGTPKGRLFPLSLGELVECAALLDAVARGELDEIAIPAHPLDVLAQQIVAEVAARECGEDELYALVRRAWPYRELARADYTEVVRMLSDGVATRLGRRGAHLHRDTVNGRLRPRRGARLAAITGGGTIPDNADYKVVMEPQGLFVGTVNEDFAVESLAGDVFQLGNNSYRILRVESGTLRVEDAHGQPPGIPFWLGEAPGRSRELSAAVSRLREDCASRLIEGNERALAWAVDDLGLERPAAEQLVEYLATGHAALGAMPTQRYIVFERFFDEAGGMQLVVHSPFGSRVNRAWGLALRKRFCRRFNFELQAAADEDAIVLSLTTTHSFPLEEVAHYLNAQTVRPLLVQALLAAPMFTARWRWVATVALALARFRAGRKVPAPLQRMDAEDLVAAVFPDQLACAENLAGEREIPDHPLVRQTIDDCLFEAMDVAGLERLLADIETGAVRTVARDLAEPSPFALEILAARPYAYLDDAPLEERRTQAVMSRRWLDPETADDLGRLDPEAVARVRDEAWPDARNAEELHDALVLTGFFSEKEAEMQPGWAGFLETLAAAGRATRLVPPQAAPVWIAAERLPQFRTLFPDGEITPAIPVPPEFGEQRWEPEEAAREILRGRLEALGPVTARSLGAPLGLSRTATDAALAALESEGFVLRGRFTDAPEETEWCERRLLARIHRYTVKRLRQEIEPVSGGDFMRFLLRWQHVTEDTRLEGRDALLTVIGQLEAFEAPAAAWEGELLPTRLNDYDPAWLDELSLTGRVTWRRLAPREGGSDRTAAPVRATPVVLLPRRTAGRWASLTGIAAEPRLGSRTRTVLDSLARSGAAFFEEIVEDTGLLRTQVEQALGELTAFGLVSADSFAGLRALLLPAERRRPVGGGKGRRRTAVFGIEDAGRWTLLRPAPAGAPDGDTLEHVARTLLRRWGVVYWQLAAAREAAWMPRWRDLLRVYRRLEARGEIRGGRFVAGVTSEQFALPEAVGLLREVRREARDGKLVALSAADPLNLVGVVVPGQRVPALAGNRVLYRDGVPLAVQVGRQVAVVDKLDGASEWEVRNALVRRRLPPPLAAYLS